MVKYLCNNGSSLLVNKMNEDIRKDQNSNVLGEL